MHAETLGHVFRAVALKGKRMLEVGCGDGRLTAQYAHLPASLVGLDPSERAIGLARERHPSIDFRVGSGEDLPFPEASFDLVFFSLSLHHQDQAKALFETARVLDSGGMAIVLEPTPLSEVDQVCAIMHNEREALARTQELIRDSNWQVALDEEFNPRWRFDNVQELYQHLFDYYARPWDHSIVEQVDQVLKGKAHDVPLFLQDGLRLMLLHPDPTDEDRHVRL